MAGNVVGAATDKADDLADDAVSGTPKWLIPGLIGLAIIARAAFIGLPCPTKSAGAVLCPSAFLGFASRLSGV